MALKHIKVKYFQNELVINRHEELPNTVCPGGVVVGEARRQNQALHVHHVHLRTTVKVNLWKHLKLVVLSFRHCMFETTFADHL